MLRFILIFIFLSAFLNPINAAEEIEDSLNQAAIIQFVTGDENQARSTLDRLAEFPVDSLIHRIRSFNEYAPADTVGKPAWHIHTISDTLQAPYYLYVPTTYDPSKPTPLMIWLHGGVSRPEFPEVDADIADHPIVHQCELNGMLLLFPLAKMGCLWWDDTGIANVLWQIRETKRLYNVDDDRVFLGGFSDGGSGSFHLAMLTPTDFAAFFPWSGHISIGSLIGRMSAFVPNLGCRPLWVTNGGADRLYPAKRMAPLLNLALSHGSELYFTAYDTAGHNYGYLDFEWQLFPERVENISRQALKPHIYWEASDLKYGSFDWIEITSIDTTAEAEEWHKDVNYRLSDDRVTIGFNADLEWEGEGVIVASVSQDSSLPAVKCGFREGDILIGLDDIPILDLKSLNDAKATKKRGDSVVLKVKRGDEILSMQSEFSPAGEYDAFVRIGKSGAVDATRLGNRFEIKASRVSSLRLKIHPEMIRLDQEVVVTVNGRKVFEGLVKPDSRFLLEEFIKNRDRSLLWAATIDVKL